MFTVMPAVPAAELMHGATRHPGFVAGVTAACALALIAAAVLVGGSLTQPPAAVANVITVDSGTTESTYTPPVSEDLSGFQLPTLPLD